MSVNYSVRHKYKFTVDIYISVMFVCGRLLNGRLPMLNLQ